MRSLSSLFVLVRCRYLAPEMLTKSKAHTFSLDWYSVGALLYDLVAGKPPHQPQTPFNHPDFKRNLFSNILKGELDVPRSLSIECQSLLRGLMTRDPVKRLGSMVGKGRPPRVYGGGGPGGAASGAAAHEAALLARQRPGGGGGGSGGGGGAAAIKAHPWFTGACARKRGHGPQRLPFTWAAAEARAIPMPWKPKLMSRGDVRHPPDLRYFDAAFLRMPVPRDLRRDAPPASGHRSSRTVAGAGGGAGGGFIRAPRSEEGTRATRARKKGRAPSMPNVVKKAPDPMAGFDFTSTSLEKARRKKQ